MTSERLTVDDLHVELRRSARRKSVELIVDRGGEIIVAAPAESSLDAVQDFVRDSKEWLYGRLARKARLRGSIPQKEYVTGEGFLYLGRSHRLLLVDQQDRPLSLRAGRFQLLRTEAANGRAHFVRWYSEHARQWLTPRVAKLSARLRKQPSAIRVQDLGFRWASCGRTGVLYFHWTVMTLPPPVVDYVAMHELLHLGIPDHSRRFWRQLENVLPDCQTHREWLAKHGAAAVF